MHNPECSCHDSSRGWRRLEPRLCSKWDFTLHQLLLTEVRPGSFLRCDLGEEKKPKKPNPPSLFSQLKLILVQPLRGIVFESRAGSVDGVYLLGGDVFLAGAAPQVWPRAGWQQGLCGQSHCQYYCALTLPGALRVPWRVPGRGSCAETRIWGTGRLSLGAPRHRKELKVAKAAEGHDAGDEGLDKVPSKPEYSVILEHSSVRAHPCPDSSMELPAMGFMVHPTGVIHARGGSWQAELSPGLDGAGRDPQSGGRAPSPWGRGASSR